ncbi:hypothetical protein K4E_25990 [Enterococcus thailandicus]|nr:hypothetical protein K4E_25990 [Enterococcus thailandicus]
MNIKDLMIKEAMIMDLQATDKAGAIDEMVPHHQITEIKDR